MLSGFLDIDPIHAQISLGFPVRDLDIRNGNFPFDRYIYISRYIALPLKKIETNNKFQTHKYDMNYFCAFFLGLLTIYSNVFRPMFRCVGTAQALALFFFRHLESMAGLGVALQALFFFFSPDFVGL